MGYQLLRLPETIPPRVKLLVRHAIEPQLRDIHSMFRLPIKEYGLEAGCNFAIAHNLLSLISGVSVMLYEQNGWSGELFRGFMDDVYWKIDPPAGIEPADATDILYDEFRNPFAHVLGFAVDFDRDTQKRHVKRRGFRLVIKKYENLTEETLVLREVSIVRPKMSSTLRVVGGTTTLLVDGLYWGLRRAVDQLLADRDRVQRAEHFLAAESVTDSS